MDNYITLTANARIPEALKQLDEKLIKENVPIRVYQGAAGWAVYYCGKYHGVWRSNERQYTIGRDTLRELEHAHSDFISLEPEGVAA